MGVLTVQVISDETSARKTLQFEPSTYVRDAIALIRDKLGLHNTDRTYSLNYISDSSYVKQIEEIGLVLTT